MSSRALVRRNNGVPVVANQRMAVAAARNMLRRAIRRRARHRVGQLARQVATEARQRMARQRQFDRNRYRRGMRKFYKVTGNASGTTHTTTRMIVRRTPKEQRFLRKMFKTNPIKTKYVNRFGFSWMGAAAASKTIWYSICHLKFNNLVKYYFHRVNDPSQESGGTAVSAGNYSTSSNRLGNTPETFIYVGKCTFQYELFNPTNYNMTVYIYDLICKHDTPYYISYNDSLNEKSSAPENCMSKGSKSTAGDMNDSADVVQKWWLGDQTSEVGTEWNTIGMKPTDYHLFNTFWKVKGIKKIVLPPTTSHHHVVVFNPKKKVSGASLFYPREPLDGAAKNGIAGLTQATLFGFQGQVATENDTTVDTTTKIGTLPGKLLVSCVKKINVWNAPLSADQIISESDLKTSWTRPTIFTDLVEQNAMAT